jgi:mitogen-activated protein kinase kinase
MSDPPSPTDPAASRPAPVPLRHPPAAPNRGVTGLLNRGSGSTPIPPSLQAKMAAVCLVLSLFPSVTYFDP